LATLSQPLDEMGNGVRGQFAAPFLSVQLGLNLFTS
jgi:glutaminase